MKRTIYTWGSGLNHSTQLFPNSVKLFHRGLKGIVAFPEWRFRPNKTKTKTKKKPNRKAELRSEPCFMQGQEWDKSKANLALQSFLLLAISSTLTGLSDSLGSEWEKHITVPFWWEAFNPWGCAGERKRTGELTNACKDQEASAGLGEGSKANCRGRKRKTSKGI